MNVLLIRSNPVDPDPPVEKMADTLIEDGHNVTILCWDRSERYKLHKNKVRIGNNLINMYRIGIPGIFGGGVKNIKQLLHFQLVIMTFLIKKRKIIDIVHSFDFDTGLVTFLFCKLFNQRYIYHILDYYVDSHFLHGNIKKIIEKLEIKVINNAEAVIICTEQRKKQIYKALPKKTVIIHNTPIPIELSTEYSIKKGTCRLVYVGILSSGRFLKELLEYVKNHKNFELHIAGFGILEKHVKSMSKNCNNIYYYGKISYDQTLNLENQCDVMIAMYDPSINNHKFAAPNKFYESLFLGKPIIMAKHTGMSEIVLENELGCVVDYNFESLCKAFDYIMSIQANWPIIAKKSKKLYKNNYDWKIMKKRITELYDNLQRSSGK